jgi:hypothetical protein
MLSVFGAMKGLCEGNRFWNNKRNIERIQSVSGLSRNSVSFYIQQLLADNWIYEKRGIIYLRATSKIASGLGLGGRLCFMISENDIHNRRLTNAILRHEGERMARSQKYYKKTLTGNKSYLDKLIETASPAFIQKKNSERCEDRFFATMCKQTTSASVPNPCEGSVQESFDMLFVEHESDYFGVSFSLFGKLFNRSKSTMHRRMAQCIKEGTVVKQNVVRKKMEFTGSLSLLDFAQKNPETYARHRVLRMNEKNVLVEVMANRYGFKGVHLARSFERV